jgi:hypothetical protein
MLQSHPLSPSLFSSASLQDDGVRVFQTLTGDKASAVIPSSALDVTTALLQKVMLELPSLSHLLSEDVFLADDMTTILVRPMISVTLTGKGSNFQDSPTELQLTTVHGLTMNSTKPTTVNYVLKKVAVATRIDACQFVLSVLHGPTRIILKRTSTLDSAFIADGSVLLIEKTARECSIV